MAPEKTAALVVTDRRSFQYPGIVLGKHEVECKTSIKYLGVQLDLRLSFGEHLKIAAAKAIQCGTNLAALCSSGLGQCLAKPCYPEEAVLGAETCRAENSFSIYNYLGERCVGPGERPANRFIGRGKAGDLSAS